MKRKRIVILFVALVLGVLALSTLLGPMRKSSLVSAAEDKPKGKLTTVGNGKHSVQWSGDGTNPSCNRSVLVARPNPWCEWLG